MNLSVEIKNCVKNFQLFLHEAQNEGFYSNNSFLIPKIDIDPETKKKILSFPMSQSEGFQYRDISWALINTKLLINNHLIGENGHYNNLTRIRESGIPKYDLELLFVRGESPYEIIEHTFYLFSDPDFETQDLNHLLGTLKYIEILWSESIDVKKLGKWEEIYRKMTSIYFIDFEKENFFLMYMKQMREYRKNNQYFQLTTNGDTEKITFNDFKLD